MRIKRTSMSLLSLFVGLAFALVVMILFVERPPECGEPSACADDYLFPAAYFASAVVVGFLALGIYAGGAESWRGSLRQLAFGSACASLLLLASFFVLSFARHA